MTLNELCQKCILTRSLIGSLSYAETIDPQKRLNLNRFDFDFEHRLCRDNNKSY